MSAAALAFGGARARVQRSGRTGPALLTGVHTQVQVDARGGGDETDAASRGCALALEHAL
jgi:hypothetical protein